MASAPSGKTKALQPVSPAAQKAGVACLLLFCFVIMSNKLPLGGVAIIGAALCMVAGRVPLRMPVVLRWYALFIALGSMGFLFNHFPASDSQSIHEVVKLLVIGIALCSLVTSPQLLKLFIVGYLALFALFPVRGALFNFLVGNTDFGRIQWNFYFSNPNDLAISCLLPLGLCGLLLLTERHWLRTAAFLGVPTLILVILLTQSRGVLIGIAVGGLYFLCASRDRLRVGLYILAAVAGAAVLAPQSVWQRLAGLSNVSMHDMSQVDPEGSAEGRWAIMGVGVKIALENPLFGVGLGNYAFAHARSAASNPDLPAAARGLRDTHSMYIRSAAEAGLGGLLAVIAIVLATLLACRRARLRIQVDSSHRRLAMAVLALEASMVAYASAAAFGSVERTTYTLFQFLIPWIVVREFVQACQPDISNPRRKKRGSRSLAVEN